MKIPGYKIIREIGQGGMATVYLAEQDSLNRKVALKVMAPALAADPVFGERFLKEARTVARLTHPGILGIYEIGTASHYHYMAMEYLEGNDLKASIFKGMTPPVAVDVLRSLASALSYAHAEGFVHRDIKPENVLFRKDGTPVLTDFGIAKAIGSGTRMTKTGMSIGTPHYMSPEQARGQSVDGRSDLYSLGAIFYEMLTGKLPYDAEDTFAVALKHVNDPVPELPQDLSAYQPLINRLMAKEPADRFADATELVRALDALSAGAQIPGAKPAKRKTGVRPPPATSGRPRRRQGLYWGLGGALLALVMFGVGFAFLFHEPSVPVFTGGGSHVAKSPPDRPSEPPPPQATIPPTAVIAEQAPSPPVAPAGKGILKVISDPLKARVELDGKPLGETPLDIELPVQRGTLELTKQYYRSAQLPVEIHKDLVTTKNVTLERGKGNLTVLSNPKGARVSLDGKVLAGRTPLSLTGMDTGMTEVSVSIDGYIDETRQIELTHGRTERLEVALKKRPEGTLRVDVTPSDARIRIMNIVPGFEQGMRLDPGSYTIEASAEGYKTRRFEAEVEAGGETRLRISLEKMLRTGDAFTNGLGMVFVYVEPGTFMMGSPSNETYRNSDERQHRVTLTKGYYMQTTPVTQGQWEAVMGSNPSSFSNCGSNCPVESVSYHDIQTFIRKLNQREEREYRLPTEAEWEYAARAGSTTSYHYGNSTGELSRYAWYRDNSRKRTRPVGQKPANAWGLYDVHGNVWEWVADWYGSYPTTAVTDPTGPSSGTYRVMRGGSRINVARFCRSAIRISFKPDYRRYNFGFRLVLLPGH